MSVQLPDFARVERNLPRGLHAWLDLLPRGLESPGLERIVADPAGREKLVREAKVAIRWTLASAYIDVDVPCIVLSTGYIRKGSDSDLYLDLLHELTHLRQLQQGFALWDRRFAYIDRPTEIEAYAVAVAEGRRLGMTETDEVNYLSVPWLFRKSVQKLHAHVCAVLDGGPIPNWEEGLNRA